MGNSELGKIFQIGNDVRQAAVSIPAFCDPLAAILEDRAKVITNEVCIGGQWIRTRYVPVYKRMDSDLATLGENDMSFDTSCVLGVIGVSQDISNRKLATLALEARTRELSMLQKKESEESEKNKLKTQFMATMSHEIRT